MTKTDRQTDGRTYRQIQKTEPAATRRPVRSAPGYFTSDELFLWYCKVQFCRHNGANHRVYKQVVENPCSFLTCRISVGRHRWRHCSCLPLNQITIQVFCLIVVDRHAVPSRRSTGITHVYTVGYLLRMYCVCRLCSINRIETQALTFLFTHFYGY